MIRRSSPAEAETHFAIQRAASLAGLAHIYPPDEYPYPDDEILRRWRETEGLVLVCERDEVPVGVAMLERCWLHGFYVLPLYPMVLVNGVLKCACPDRIYKVGPDPKKWKCSPGKHPYSNLIHGVKDATNDPKLVDLVARLNDVIDFEETKVLYNWLGATRLDWRGQGQFRALTEEQEVWAVARGYGEVVVKTKNRYYGMRGTLDSLQFNVVKLEAATDPLDSKVYLSKRLGPGVLDAHRGRRKVVRV